MGIYAHTDIQIDCKNKKAVKDVINAINKAREDNKGDMNYDFDDLRAIDNSVNLFKQSARVQNLEYQIEELWERVKYIDGVVELTAPTMMEGDCIYFSNEEGEEDE